MFNKEKETNEAIGMIQDMSKLFDALNTRQSKNTDLTFQTTMRFLTLMEVLVEKRIITPDESTRIMNEGKDD